MFEKLKTRNKWKLLFISLGVVNLAIITLLIFLLFVPNSPARLPSGNNPEGEVAEFTISSSKQNLNQIMNNFLEELPKKKNFDYSISLKNDLELRGSIVAFEQKIPMAVTFEPVVQKNGDLVLQQKSIKLGRLQLPNKKVLEYLKDNYELPEWVVINPSEENIYIAITQMETKSNLKVEVKKFNLEKNELVFKVKIPHEAFNYGKKGVNLKGFFN
ncbi:YpmS family protein [Bacillus tianshenii]|nr:YpmS family protein [Bacillus tianshenii]